MFVRGSRQNSLKLLLWFLFQHPQAITLPRKSRVTRLESMNLSNALSSSMGGPQAHVKLRTRIVSVKATFRQQIEGVASIYAVDEPAVVCAVTLRVSTENGDSGRSGSGDYYEKRTDDPAIHSAEEAMNRAMVCDDRCALAHFLNNKINIIFGTCDLLSQHTTDPQVVDRLLAIRVAAKAMIDEINKPPSRSQNA
jgi:hypothetical protein